VARQRLLAGGVVLLLGAFIAAASLRGEPRRRLRYTVEADEGKRISPAALADWILQGRRDFVVIDMRERAAFDQGHIRAAVSCGTCHESRDEGRKAQASEQFVDLSKKLVFYTATGAEDVTLPKLLHDNPDLYLLSGGWAGWQREVLEKRPLEGLEGEAREGWLRHEAVRAFFSGERPATATEAKLPVTPIKRSGAHKEAGPSEGC
jgi:rhodanese-related sulfurtransferase